MTKENTQIYKLLDSYDALPSQPSWKDLKDNIRDKYREYETMFTDGKSEEEIMAADNDLVNMFNQAYGDTEEAPVDEHETGETNTKEKEEQPEVESDNKQNKVEVEELVDDPEKKGANIEEGTEKKEKKGEYQEIGDNKEGINKAQELSDKKTEKTETKQVDVETKEEQQEAEKIENIEKPEELSEKKVQELSNNEESGNVVKNIENESSIEMETKNNEIIENNGVTTETENEAAKMLEELEKEQGGQKKVPEKVENTQAETEVEEVKKTVPQPYADFIQWAMTQEMVSAKDLIRFNVPPELWHEDKQEIQVGNLILRKTDVSQLMFNRWTVIKQ